METKQLSYLQIITLACILVATFFLPLKTSISNIGLIGVIVTTVIALIRHGFNKDNTFLSFLFFSPMVFFLPLLLGIWYTNYRGEAIHEIIKYAFLGLTPLFLYRKDIDINLYKKYAIIGLLMGSSVSALYLLGINLGKFLYTGIGLNHILDNKFMGVNFLAPFEGLHPVYLGAYYAMALAVLLFGKFKLSKPLRALLFIVISLTIVLLASRIIYFVSFLMVCLYLIHYLPFKVFAVMVTLGLIVLVVSIPKLEQTGIYKKVVFGTKTELKSGSKKLTKQSRSSTKKDSRFSRWEVAFESIIEHPFLGVGGGAENEVLLQKYKAYQMQDSIERQYNAHNQFLGFTIRFGIVGVILLCIYFIRNTIAAIKYQHLLFLAFLTILFWTFMVENILDRNMGINFVALFGTLFYAEFLNVNTLKGKHAKDT